MKKAITKISEQPVKTGEVEGTASVSDAFKKFGGFVKKPSVIVSSNTQSNNHHLANISSVNYSNGVIITSDFAGFIKVWNI